MAMLSMVQASAYASREDIARWLQHSRMRTPERQHGV